MAAWVCPGNYRGLVFESIDADTIVPHLFPLAVAYTYPDGTTTIDTLVGPANQSLNCPPGEYMWSAFDFASHS